MDVLGLTIARLALLAALWLLLLPVAARGQGFPVTSEAQKALAEAESLAQQGKTREARAHYLQAIRQNPRFTRAFEQYSLFLFAQGRHREGAKAMRIGLELNPGRVELKAHLAMHLYRLGRIADAYRLFKGSASAQRHRYEVQIVYAQVALLAEDHGATIRAIQAYLRHRPESLSAKDYVLRVQLATALLRSGQTGSAERELEAVLRARPRYTRAKIARAELLVRRGRCAEAEAVYRQLAPRLKELDLSLGLGEALGCLRRHHDAVAAASSFLGRHRSALTEILAGPEGRDRQLPLVASLRRALLLRGASSIEIGKPGPALADLSSAERLDGGPRATLLVARALFDLGRYPQAIEKLSARVSLGDPRALVLSLRAAIRSRRIELALSCAERLLRAAKPTASHLYYAGIAQSSAGRFDRAAQVLARAVKAAPGATRARDELVRAHGHLALRAFRRAELDRALGHLRDAARLTSSLAVHRDLALIHLRQGQGELALAEAERALGLAPRDAVARRLAGRALILLGRPGEAIDRFQGALRELGSSDLPLQAKLLCELARARAASGAFEAAATDLERASRLAARDEALSDLRGPLQRNLARVKIALASALLDRNQTTAAARALQDARAGLRLLPEREQETAELMMMLGSIHSGNLPLARAQNRALQGRLGQVLLPAYSEVGARLLTAYLELHSTQGAVKQRSARSLEGLAARAPSPARERLRDLAARAYGQAAERHFSAGANPRARDALLRIKRLGRETPELRHNLAVLDHATGGRAEAVKALEAIATRVPMALCNLAVHFELTGALERAHDHFRQCDQRGARYPGLKALLSLKKQIFGR